NVSDGGTISAVYNDADDGTGSPAVVTADGTADCTAPVISDVVIDQVQVAQATVSFTTDEPALGRVRYGTACGSLTGTAQSSLTVLSHSCVRSGLMASTTYFVSVEADDVAGNTGTNANSGAC